MTLQDLKRYTGATITAVNGDELTIQAKRGSVGVCFTTTPLGLSRCIERAYEKRQRKTSFAEFCSSLHAPANAKRVNPQSLSQALF